MRSLHFTCAAFT